MEQDLTQPMDQNMAQQGPEMGMELTPDEAAASLAFATNLSEQMMVPQQEEMVMEDTQMAENMVEEDKIDTEEMKKEMKKEIKDELKEEVKNEILDELEDLLENEEDDEENESEETD